MRKNNNNDNLTQYFLTGTLFILVFFGFYFLFNEFKHSSEHDSASVDIRKMEKRIDDEVNKHLRVVETEKRLRALDVDAKNFEMSQSFKNQAQKWKPLPPTASAEIYDEDMSSGTKDLSSLSIEEKLRVEMDSNRRVQQVAETATPMTKEEYVRAYKENALRDGWIVEVNENMEIISAQRLEE